jgi:hypothetical protein
VPGSGLEGRPEVTEQLFACILCTNTTRGKGTLLACLPAREAVNSFQINCAILRPHDYSNLLAFRHMKVKMSFPLDL